MAAPRGLGGAACQAQASRRMGRCGPARCGRHPAEIGPVMQAHNLLGEPLWRPSAPKGFADESAPWLDGLAQRLDIANQFARRLSAESRSARGVRRGARAARFGRNAAGDPARRKSAAGARASVHGAGIPAPMTRTPGRLCHTGRGIEGDKPMTFNARRDPPRTAPGLAARCSPGPMCRNWRARKAAIHACWSSCCAARSMGLRRWRRWAIRTGPRYGATRRSRWTASSARAAARLLLRTQSGDAEPVIVSTRPARPRLCMRRRRLTGSAPISTARTCWKADSPSLVRPTADGSIARLPRCNRAGACRRFAATPSRSVRSRRWLCAGRRRCCRGRRGGCPRRAMTR